MILLFLLSDSFIEMAETVLSVSTAISCPLQSWWAGMGEDSRVVFREKCLFSTTSVVFPHVSLVMSIMGTEVLSCVNCVFSTEFNNLFLTWMAFENELILINARPC